MAFLIKSTKLIYNFVGLGRQRALTCIKSQFLFLDGSRAININKLTLRTAVSLAAKNQEILDKELFQLSRDVLTRNIHELQIENVLQQIKSRGKMSYPELILLLRCCTDVLFMCPEEKRVQLAEKIWQFAQESGVEFDIRPYNALLNVYLSNNHKFSPLEFLSQIEKEGIEPNHYTYRRILKAFAQKGDFQGVSTILDTMKKLNIPLMVDDFNALILCHCEMGLMEKASEIIKVMQEKDLEPNSVTYDFFLCGYAKQGNIEKIEEYIKNLQNEHLFLKESTYLNIICELVLNNHEDKIDNIFKYMFKNVVYSKFGMRVIQKLLHYKKDDAAIKIMGLIDETEETEANKSDYTKHILQHFTIYRKPSEILELCKLMEKKGWTTTALSYSLRQIYLYKDEKTCLNFLNCMSSKGIPLRWHYYWPPLITASKKGNENMIKVIKILPRTMLHNCFDTCYNVIIPNYKLGPNWRDDYENLKSLGINSKYLNASFLSKFIEKGNLEDAVELLSTNALPDFRIRSSLILLADSLQVTSKEKKCDVKSYVNILYYLAHDDGYSQFFLLDSRKSKNFFDIALTTLLSRNTKEKIFKDILEEMVEKKMGITSSLVEKITSKFQSEEVKKLADKLATLQFELDDSVMKQKMGDLFDPADRDYSLNILSSGSPVSVDDLWKEIESKESFDHCILVLRKLVNLKKYKEAFKIAENLSSRKELIPDSGAASLYFSFIFDLCDQNETDLAEQAFDLGVYTGILDRNDIIKLIRRILHRGSKKDVNKAVDKFCKYISESRSFSGVREFLKKIVARGDEDNVKKLLAATSDYDNNNLSTFYLIAAYLEIGDIKKAKKLLNSKHGSERFISEKIFYRHCLKMYNEWPSTIIKNYVEITKELENFDRTRLCKFLLKKYIDEENVDAAIKLLSEMRDECDVQYDFIRQIDSVMAEPTLQNFKKFAARLLPTKTERLESVRNRQLDESDGKNPEDNNEQPNDTMRNPKHKENIAKIQELALCGKVDEVIKFVEENDIRLNKAAYAFTKNQRTNEYLEFLNHYVKSNKFEEVADCFYPMIAKWNDELFSKYKSLAIECYEKGKVIGPLSGLLLTSIGYNIKEAEELIEKYQHQIKTLPFSEIKGTVNFSKIKLLENILHNEKLKSAFSKNLHLIYNYCIKHKCEAFEIDAALRYLTMAVEEGVHGKISQGIINLLKKKLKKEGKSFPYSELYDQFEKDSFKEKAN